MLKPPAADASITDIVAHYDELLFAGSAPPIPDYCAVYPHIPDLASRLTHLEQLRGELQSLFSPFDSAVSVATQDATTPQVPGFDVLRLLGEGGMGRVFLAEQHSPHRLCALKVVDNALPHALERFQREADLAARLNHPGVATVYAFGGDEHALAYLATEWVQGFSLRDLLRAADLASEKDGGDWFINVVHRLSSGLRAPKQSHLTTPIKPAVDLIIQVGDALAHAHRQGVVHRDIKPSNILVGIDGRAKLIDFGIAVARGIDADRMTRTGTFVGSFGYAAPEQLRGEHHRVGPWTDTYALGVTLFEMLTQRMPFDTLTFAERLSVSDSAPEHGPRYYNRKISHALDAVIRRALHPEPERRFHDAEEMVEALRACRLQAAWWERAVPSRLAALVSRLLPQGTAQWGFALAVIFVGFFAYLYEHEHLVHRRFRLATMAAQEDSAYGLLDLQLQASRQTLEDCLLYDRRLLLAEQKQARFVAKVKVVKTRVVAVGALPETFGLGMRAQQCLLQGLEELSMPGIGFEEPLELRVDLRVLGP